MPGSNIGRSSDSPSKPGQCLRCSSMNSVAIWIASAFESVFRIAQPPMTSLASANGPSLTVIFPLASRTRTPSLLGSRPPVSTRVPFLSDFSTNLPMASINAGGGPDSRCDSGWRMNVRYFMAPPGGVSDPATNEPRLDRHSRNALAPRQLVEADAEEACESLRLLGRSSPHPGRLASEGLDPHFEAAVPPFVPPDAFDVAVHQERRRDPTLRPEDASLVRRRKEAARAGRTDDVRIECGQEPDRARLRGRPGFS